MVLQKEGAGGKSAVSVYLLKSNGCGNIYSPLSGAVKETESSAAKQNLFVFLPPTLIINKLPF